MPRAAGTNDEDCDDGDSHDGNGRDEGACAQRTNKMEKPEKAMCVVLPSASPRLVSIRRVPPITLIQSKEDEMEEMLEHLSLDASVRLKARDFKLLQDFRIYLKILNC